MFACKLFDIVNIYLDVLMFYDDWLQNDSERREMEKELIWGKS